MVTYSQTVVWSEVGGAMRLARNARAWVSDPVTGDPVDATQGGRTASYVDTDAAGRCDFTAASWPVRIASSLAAGAPSVIVAPIEAPTLLATAVSGAAASAATASAAVDTIDETIATWAVDTSDLTVASLVGGSTSTRSAVDARVASEVTDRIAEFARDLPRVGAKLATGQSIKVAFIGDSGFEGLTSTTPGTDDAASLICTDLAARFGVTVTKSNRAVSGHTPFWHMLPSIANPTRFDLALADAADLYVISFGHNDIRSDIASPGTGYPQAASMAALEHMIRRIRLTVPGADIIVSNEWPYTGGAAGSNTALTAHARALARLAAHHGCAFVDFTGALAALGVTGSNPTIDDVYIHAVGETWAQHPTSAGHRVWADAVLALLPAGAPVSSAATSSIPVPLYTPARYGKWVTSAAMSVRNYGTDGYRLVGSWAGTATLPVTSSTATDYIDVHFVGSECALRLDTGAGQGVVAINVDAVTVYASLNLGTHGSGQSWVPLTGLGPGYHRVTVTLVSGSVTYRGLEVLTAPVEKIKWDSTRITYTGTWTDLTTDASRYWGTAKWTTTLNDSFTVQFVGTMLTLAGLKYTTATLFGVTVDGVALADANGAGATANNAAGMVLCSGLPYGRHTAVVSLKSAGRALLVSGLAVYDETRTERPTIVRGVAVVGETVALHVPLPGVPSVRMTPADATSTVPPYPSSRTTSALTVNGTASALVEWEAESGRSAW